MFGLKKMRELEARVEWLERELFRCRNNARGLAHDLSTLQKVGKRRAKYTDFAHGVTAWKEGDDGRIYQLEIKKNPGLYGMGAHEWIAWIGGPGGTIPVDLCSQVWWVEDQGE